MYDNFETFMLGNFLLKDSFIILHSDSFRWMFFFILRFYRNIHWVCWGSGTVINRSIKSYISAPIKFFLYRRLKSIITLSNIDTNNLRLNFKVKNIEQISYFESVNTLFNFDKKLFSVENKLIADVFIGNNSSAINSYLPLVVLLKKFKNQIKITAMLNYDLVKNETYNNLISFGKLNYHTNFSTDESFYDLKDYPRYIDRCDIYICAIEEQTGLGAIYSALKLGKKIFLAGNNFDYIKSLGCKINHVDEIPKMKVEAFLEPLSLEIQYHNFDVIMNILNDDKLIAKWQFFYNKYRH
ncbi:hypothetical protein PGH12_08250 [Chryseobacterium wangxinyae]|uniref:hypothetical protein n=1 Tax=Chryseobacterium sp. CY350 TaxID=2997336 RepID=UPI00226F64FC|nr:hypothetical protein [Chryseobacterium sp. CY350]WBZ97130.1 hypothetical protein PGH12_08250 [Chryseobacterium sp. CY350]